MGLNNWMILNLEELKLNWINKSEIQYTESRKSAEPFECRLKSVEWIMNELKGSEVILLKSADAKMLHSAAEAECWINTLNLGNLLNILKVEWSH